MSEIDKGKKKRGERGKKRRKAKKKAGEGRGGRREGKQRLAIFPRCWCLQQNIEFF